MGRKPIRRQGFQYDSSFTLDGIAPEKPAVLRKLCFPSSTPTLAVAAAGKANSDGQIHPDLVSVPWSCSTLKIVWREACSRI
jgi:hypothetical protein